ncbi:MAG: hypothetical protein JRI23_18355 [Deltaproteobacteria bacterium]|nr:hypothetical protein [Deltaproteobacteria bacterium]MBW2533821.1 hypothetical protein [Deltaproteobacteria bacterium]
MSEGSTKMALLATLVTGAWGLAIATLGCRADDRPAPTATTTHPEPTAAVTRCQQALQQVRGTDVQAQRIIAQGCQDLFALDGCRQAWGRLDPYSPHTRASAVASACAAAYCPVLRPPLPALCTRQVASLRPSELATLWNELFPVILAHDLGPELSRDVGKAFKETAERVAASRQ